MTKEQQRELIDIKDQIVKHFTKSDWLDFGFTLGSYEVIEKHPRLLRSLNFGDDDYEGNVLEILSAIAKKDTENFDRIKSYLLRKLSTPLVSDMISTAHKETPRKIITFAPQVFEIPNKPQDDNLVAVMLPFSLKESFQAVKTACTALHLECVKADDLWENSTFIQDIFELIFTCRIVIADMTGRNPNVFYEIGIAHTLGKTVIPITQSITDLPSDLKHHRALVYHANEQGYKNLTEDIEKRLKTLFPNLIKF